MSQSTALVPYKPPVSTAEFIENEAVRGEKMVAKCFTDQELEGRATAQLASKVASKIIFSNAQHPAAKIIAGYNEDFHFVDVSQVCHDDFSLGEMCPTIEFLLAARFYAPNNRREGFYYSAANWSDLKWKYDSNLPASKELFTEKLKNAKEREARGEILYTRSSPQERIPAFFSEGCFSSIELQREADPDLLKLL